jgi:hypothetical protein
LVAASFGDDYVSMVIDPVDYDCGDGVVADGFCLSG